MGFKHGMVFEGWKTGEDRQVSMLEWLGMDSWRRRHPGQRKCLEVENTVGDGGGHGSCCGQRARHCGRHRVENVGWKMIRKEARRTWICVDGASPQAVSCQVACDFWAEAVAILFMFLSPGYDPDFICRSDLGSSMGPAQPLWGLKDDG